ncbi:hypothetical protein V9T40_001132 [Parthenolecanium corni]|uniref:CRK SH3-binding GNRP n=1 Tax=Parthenolecanium corni TaxID=536013 RepID=A0AAN9TEP8_9HEMI
MVKEDIHLIKAMCNISSHYYGARSIPLPPVVQIALRFFHDVISKNKLEMLPGNGTIVLESIANIHSALKKSYALDEQSSLIVSGLNRVYQSVAGLIKLCDDLLIRGEKVENKEYVTETIQYVEEAVQNLVSIATDKVNERENRSFQSECSTTSSRCSTISSDLSQYRVSMPEIVMSPNELQQLERNTQSVMDCHSSRNQDTNENPPPKPPLPPSKNFNGSPPPLPPKKRNMNSHVTSSSTSSSMLVPSSLSLEGLSLRSDNSSVASFDSSTGLSRVDTDDSSCKQLSRVSSSFSGFMSSNNSSHSSFAEHQQQQQQQQQHTIYSTSTVDGVVVTTAKSETYSYVSKTIATSPVSKDGVTDDDDTPPALPVKRIKKPKPNLTLFKHEDCLSRLNALSASNDDILSNGHDSESSIPPPLPPKKKHIMAYMEMFGNCSPRSSSELLQNTDTVSSYSFEETEWQQQEMISSSSHSCSFQMLCSSNHSSMTMDLSSPPTLPPRRSHLSSISSQSPASTLTPTSPLPPIPHPSNSVEDKAKTPTVMSPLKKDFFNGVYENHKLVDDDVLDDPLAEIDVSKWLVFKRPEEDGPDIRGGHPDALIVLATKANKNDFLYQEAFLTTYRTFISPSQLVEKLIERYRRFDTPCDSVRQRVARESFSLLVRVIGDLTIMDLREYLIKLVMDFVYQLIYSGDLLMGKALRIKLLEKYVAKLQYYANRAVNGSLSAQNIYTRQSTLFDFKSEHIAEQMTLLDAELFNNIEIPEVLIWTQEQDEKTSPNLTRFTEHFNKVSFWARSRILEQTDAKDRERYVVKFIKIMKHLRKLNNYNSYLALLAALDSAPVRRLEWQKHITDGLKEYCALIDSSSSFRAYRQALVETQPPCIPYIGLVLQDLTFVHIGNNDYLSEGVINFSKRWQQFHIVENMKRFKKLTYSFKSGSDRDRIIAFFSNFDEFICEEAMWQISESIKPRGKKATTK